MKLTQGCFSFLPDLTDEQISSQVQYCLGKGWAVNIEFTDDPHPRNNFWEMWGLPMFDLPDAAGVLMELNQCRKVYGGRYIDPVPNVGHYYPSAGRIPGYGRLEIEPPSNRRLPQPAESYHQSWSAQSAPLPAQSNVPLNPPEIIYAPRDDRRGPHNFPR
jgi:hypothetical protein